jgi:hypothetical protein
MNWWTKDELVQRMADGWIFTVLLAVILFMACVVIVGAVYDNAMNEPEPKCVTDEYGRGCDER